MSEMDPRLLATPSETPVVPVQTTPTPVSDNTSTPIIKSGKVYDILHFTALILLPAVAALYFAVADIWNLPNATQVVGSLTALDTFLGALVGVSKAQYNNSEQKYAGEIQTVEDNGKKIYQLVLNSDPELLDQAKQVIFKIKNVL